ncbi:MAG: DUF1365 domain-containing protein [Deltaproteobacteria bacterium]|nr:DUF1365 domain-containing protein [Deltaproteobacteria bacterium]
MALASALYVGQVRHRRYAPRPHAFRYRLFQLYLDLDELPRVFAGRWLWRLERRGVAAFHRADYLGDPRQPLADAVRDLVAARLGRRPAGPIRVLTHLRYLGYCFNPVSFYYCFDARAERVEAIVAEITNTPWNERHAYVLGAADNLARHRTHHHRFGKQFHVSPFLAMDYEYDWRFTPPGERLVVHMQNRRPDGLHFDATLSLRRRPITTATLTAALAAYPWMTGKVFAAIHWQAARLWWRGTPVFDHP